MGLFGKKKKKEEEILSIIFDVDSRQMVHVKCPYCMSEIDCIIVHRLDKSKYVTCPHCEKPLV